MTRILVLAAALMATAPLPGRTAQPVQPVAAQVHTVSIESMSFHPGTLVVRRGDRITWTNRDPFPHTVTATNGKFDSHLIAPGASWTYVARKPGEYDYVCTLHVAMKGKIVVH